MTAQYFFQSQRQQESMQIDREMKRSKKSRQTDKQGTILYTNKQIFKTGYCAMCEKRDKNAERA